jgi:hypothetical protein
MGEGIGIARFTGLLEVGNMESTMGSSCGN